MKEKMKILDLFSGIGGFSLGLESTGHFETTAFCEIDKFCKLILNKHWEGKKIYDDVKAISKKQFEEDGIELPDIITGGFPCQPFSVAGKQQGTSDSRHLWPEMFRIIKDFAPVWIIAENVKGLTNIQDGMVFETVCSDLEGEGYEVRTFNIPAAGVQAPHRRERLWIIANRKESMVDSNNFRFKQYNETEKTSSRGRTSATIKSTGSNVVNPFSQYESEPIRESNGEESRIQEEHRQNDSTTRESSRTGSVWGTNNGHEDMENSRRTLRSRGELQGENENETRKGNAYQSQRSSGTSESNVVDSSTGRCTSQETEVQPGRYSSFDSSWWQSEPELGRVANGVHGRVHRLKSLGNSIVPKIVQEIGNAIIEAEKEKDLEILDQRNGM